MTVTVDSKGGLDLEQEVDLLQYLNALLASKFRILIIAIVGAMAVFGISRLIDDVYTASAILAININEKPGGMAQGSYRGSDLVGLIEHDFIIDNVAENETERLLARMRSTAFAQLFIDENDLLRYLYPQNWDEATDSWVNGNIPSAAKANILFRTKFSSVDLDQTSGLLAVRFNTPDPKLSADLANKFWKRFNVYIRELESSELNRRREYLEARLAGLANLEMQRSIFRLMETQLAAEALLYARGSYPLEEIQPATAPLFKSYPSRKAWTVMSFIGLLLLGIVFVIARVVCMNVASALASYRVNSNTETIQSNKKSNFESKNAPAVERSPVTTIPTETAKLNIPQSAESNSLDEWIDRP